MGNLLRYARLWRFPNRLDFNSYYLPRLTSDIVFDLDGLFEVADGELSHGAIPQGLVISRIALVAGGQVRLPRRSRVIEYRRSSVLSEF